ncbi:MAG: hypothetical protein LBO00_07560 [Zoogloeaceae bacterium]|jgi:hypothetical protein|nr:hypothetical protein [Zoogloeaceae bacterium]
MNDKKMVACVCRNGVIVFRPAGKSPAGTLPFALGAGGKLRRAIRQLARLGAGGVYFVPGVQEAGEDDDAATAALSAFSTRVKEALLEEAS